MPPSSSSARRGECRRAPSRSARSIVHDRLVGRVRLARGEHLGEPVGATGADAHRRARLGRARSASAAPMPDDAPVTRIRLLAMSTPTVPPGIPDVRVTLQSRDEEAGRPGRSGRRGRARTRRACGTWTVPRLLGTFRRHDDRHRRPGRVPAVRQRGDRRAHRVHVLRAPRLRACARSALPGALPAARLRRRLRFDAGHGRASLVVGCIAQPRATRQPSQRS